MTTLQTSSSERLYTLRHTRPTIALICDIPWNQYSCDMWAGVRDATQALDANLFYFAGGILDFAVNYRQQANIIYERISLDTLDGLVIWGGQLAHIVGTSSLSRIIFLVAAAKFTYVFSQNHREYEA